MNEIELDLDLDLQFELDLDLATTASIEDVLQAIQDREGTPPDKNRMVFAGKQLERGRTLADYNILSGSTLRLRERNKVSLGAYLVTENVSEKEVGCVTACSARAACAGV